jgi:alpha-L-arabinofuranosidase
VTARVLAGDPHDHNTFDAPTAVEPTELEVKVENGELCAMLPPCSVAAFTLKA